MKKYVCGFLFSPDKKEVILLLKKYPQNYEGGNRFEDQAGKLNGTGGLVPDGEDYQATMSIQHRKDTGVDIAPERWSAFAELAYPGGLVFFYHATAASVSEFEAHATQTDEQVIYKNISDITNFKGSHDTMDNIPFLMLVALSPTRYFNYMMVHGDWGNQDSIDWVSAHELEVGKDIPALPAEQPASAQETANTVKTDMALTIDDVKAIETMIDYTASDENERANLYGALEAYSAGNVTLENLPEALQKLIVKHKK